MMRARRPLGKGRRPRRAQGMEQGRVAGALVAARTSPAG